MNKNEKQEVSVFLFLNAPAPVLLVESSGPDKSDNKLSWWF